LGGGKNPPLRVKTAGLWWPGKSKFKTVPKVGVVLYPNPGHPSCPRIISVRKNEFREN